MILEMRLTFKMYLKCIIQNAKKTNELVWKLHPIFPKASLVIIDNSVIRPPLCYED